MSNDLISLREVRATDLDAFFEHQCEPEALRMAAFPPRSYEQFMAHWEKCMAEDTGALRTIVYREEVVGNIVCWKQAGDHKIGYWLGKSYWGKGIASAALGLFLREMTTRPLYAHAAKRNIASIRVLEKSGFTIVGEDTFEDANGETIAEVTMRLGDAVEAISTRE